MAGILSNKFYNEPSVFLPENLLREARRQKQKKECRVPTVCLLDPDGDLAAQQEGDFEKGGEFGSVDTLNLIEYVLNVLE